METTRVRIDSGDPCPDCGSPATVFERTVELDWVEELRECSRGCTEVAAAIPFHPVRTPVPRRRRRVA